MSDPINVSLLQARFAELQRENDTLRKKGDTGGGPPPGGSDMEKRIEKLEQAIPDIRERLVRVETRLESIEKTMATKADLDVLKGAISTDLHKAIGEQTWRFITVACVLAGIAFTAARFIPGG